MQKFKENCQLVFFLNTLFAYNTNKQKSIHNPPLFVIRLDTVLRKFFSKISKWNVVD